MAEARRTIGRFEVLERLGRGGMGAVFRARDPRLNRVVAIKVIRDDAAQEPEFLRRFEREAIAAARLNSPHIVTLYEFGEADGEPFLVMELVEGPSLAELILRREPLGVDRRLRLVEDVCAGLAEAHRAGIIHRDVKPANILVTPAGRAKIVDFGIARLGDASTAAQPRGTLPYMSPEQVNGKPLDARSDLFSVGAVLYEVLTYRRAFAGDMADVLRKILLDEPPSLRSLVPGIDPALEAIVGRALKKEPADRFASAEELGGAIEAVRVRLEAPPRHEVRAETPRADTLTVPILPRRAPDAPGPAAPAAAALADGLVRVAPAVPDVGADMPADEPPAHESPADEPPHEGAGSVPGWSRATWPRALRLGLPVLALAVLVVAALWGLSGGAGPADVRVVQMEVPRAPTWIGISGDGRYLAIESAYDVFSFDLLRDELIKIGEAYEHSPEPAGDQFGIAPHPAITPDGAFIAYQRTTRGILGSATPVAADVFVWSRATQRSEQVNVSRSLRPAGDALAWGPTISDDGRLVAFASTARDLVAGDTNGLSDIFVRDRRRSATIRISAGAAGTQRNCPSDSARLSGNGRFVAYRSCDDRGAPRTAIYLHDLETRRVTQVTGPTGLDLCSDVLHPERPLVALDGDAATLAFGALVSTRTEPGGEPPCALATYSRATGRAALVKRSDGRPVHIDPGSPLGLSSDGRFLSFVSASPTLTAGDANGAQDVFVMDLADRTIQRLPANREGEADKGGLLVGWAPTGAHAALFPLTTGIGPRVDLRHLVERRSTILVGPAAAASR